MASYLMQTIREYTREMTNNGLPSFGAQIDPEKLRNQVEAAQAEMPLQEGVTYEACSLNGIETELSTPAYAREDAVIMYMHGGGLVCGNALTSRGYAGMVAGESRIPVYTCTYRLAPENPYPAASDDCFAAYRAMLEKHPNTPVCLIGESGGAYLCLSTALMARDQGIQMPAALVLSSPVIDFNTGLVDHTGYGYDDITITQDGIRAISDCYVPDVERRAEPYCSPAHADFSNFSPTYVSWDKGEMLAADAEFLVEKLIDARVPIKYKRFEGCFHAFAPVGRNTPESSELLDDSIAFMLEHLHDQSFEDEKD